MTAYTVAVNRATNRAETSPPGLSKNFRLPRYDRFFATFWNIWFANELLSQNFRIVLNYPTVNKILSVIFLFFSICKPVFGVFGVTARAHSLVLH